MDRYQIELPPPIRQLEAQGQAASRTTAVAASEQGDRKSQELQAMAQRMERMQNEMNALLREIDQNLSTRMDVSVRVTGPPGFAPSVEDQGATAAQPASASIGCPGESPPTGATSSTARTEFANKGRVLH